MFATTFAGKHLVDDGMPIEGMALGAVTVLMEAAADRFAFQLVLELLVFC